MERVHSVSQQDVGPPVATKLYHGGGRGGGGTRIRPDRPPILAGRVPLPPRGPPGTWVGSTGSDSWVRRSGVRSLEGRCGRVVTLYPLHLGPADGGRREDTPTPALPAFPSYWCFRRLLLLVTSPTLGLRDPGFHSQEVVPPVSGEIPVRTGKPLVLRHPPPPRRTHSYESPVGRVGRRHTCP